MPDNALPGRIYNNGANCFRDPGDIRQKGVKIGLPAVDPISKGQPAKKHSQEFTMYTLLRSMTLRQLLLEQAPVLLVSFVLAEVFYKFHSFTLEALAFLATWYVLGGVVDFIKRKTTSHR